MFAAKFLCNSLTTLPSPVSPASRYYVLMEIRMKFAIMTYVQNVILFYDA